MREPLFCMNCVKVMKIVQAHLIDINIYDFMWLLILESIVWPFDRFCNHSSQELCQLSGEHTLCSMCARFSAPAPYQIVFSSPLTYSKSYSFVFWFSWYTSKSLTIWIYSKNLRNKYLGKYYYSLCKSNNFYYYYLVNSNLVWSMFMFLYSASNLKTEKTIEFGSFFPSFSSFEKTKT